MFNNNALKNVVRKKLSFGKKLLTFQDLEELMRGKLGTRIHGCPIFFNSCMQVVECRPGRILTQNIKAPE